MNKSEINKLIEDNTKLVYGLINKEYPTFSCDEDIIQCGMFGLCKAANNWDSTKSAFSTYAYKCIRNEIYQEFRRRKPHSSNVSLETKIADNGTLSDVLLGDDDVSFIDYDEFCESLTPVEVQILELCKLGYTKDEIGEIVGYKAEKVRRTVRELRLKWREFCGDSY